MAWSESNIHVCNGSPYCPITPALLNYDGDAHLLSSSIDIAHARVSLLLFVRAPNGTLPRRRRQRFLSAVHALAKSLRNLPHVVNRRDVVSCGVKR